MSEGRRNLIARFAGIFIGLGAAIVGNQVQARLKTQPLDRSARMSVLDFMQPAMRADVVSGRGVMDHTPAIQAAITEATAGPQKSVYFPDGLYNLSGGESLKIGGSDTSVVTGLRFYGESVGGVTIRQSSDNIPLFMLTGLYINELIFENMTLSFANMQTEKAMGSIFRVNGPGNGSIYECVWRNIRADNFHWFMDAPNILWWGNAYRDMWLGDFAYGVNNLTGAAGKPRCTFDNIYVTCQSATGVLFNHHALTGNYCVEVNSANRGATMLYDGGGGTHIIKHWALEVGTYASNKTLYNVPNGRIIGDYIYTSNIRLNPGVTVTAFLVAGPHSSLDVRCYVVYPFGALGESAVFYVAASTGPLRSHFRQIVAPFSANVKLSNVTGTLPGDFVVVDEWNDASAIAYLRDDDAAIAYDAPVNQILDVPMTANRTKTIPDVSLPGNPLFSGRRFRFVKATLSDYTLTVQSHNGTVIGSIPARSKGALEIIWRRGGDAKASGWIVVQEPGKQ